MSASETPKRIAHGADGADGEGVAQAQAGVEVGLSLSCHWHRLEELLDEGSPSLGRQVSGAVAAKRFRQAPPLARGQHFELTLVAMPSYEGIGADHACPAGGEGVVGAGRKADEVDLDH